MAPKPNTGPRFAEPDTVNGKGRGQPLAYCSKGSLIARKEGMLWKLGKMI
jgi:hypothetical protein